MTQGPTKAMVQHVKQKIPPGAALQQSLTVPEISQQYDSSPNPSIPDGYSLDGNRIVNLRNLKSFIEEISHHTIM